MFTGHNMEYLRVRKVGLPPLDTVGETTIDPMNGALIIDKPAGFTSHDVVARVRKIAGERRVGHTGTLDPFATGVLVLLLGRATRLAQFLSGAEKEYEAVIRLGYSTHTGDVTGAKAAAGQTNTLSAQSLSREEIDAAMASLTGKIEQVPPMYSAKKIAGRKLYEHARRGEEIERPPVRVTIREFELLSQPHQSVQRHADETCDLHVRVVCSAGTYIRTLAEDLGRKLGIGAHLAELRRTRAGRFALAEAVTLDELTNFVATGALDRILISPSDTLSNLACVELDSEEARRTVHGVNLPVDDEQMSSLIDGAAVRMMARGELYAVGRFDAKARVIHPSVVLAGH